MRKQKLRGEPGLKMCPVCHRLNILTIIMSDLDPEVADGVGGTDSQYVIKSASKVTLSLENGLR